MRRGSGSTVCLSSGFRFNKPCRLDVRAALPGAEGPHYQSLDCTDYATQDARPQQGREVFLDGGAKKGQILLDEIDLRLSGSVAEPRSAFLTWSSGCQDSDLVMKRSDHPNSVFFPRLQGRGHLQGRPKVRYSCKIDHDLNQWLTSASGYWPPADSCGSASARPAINASSSKARRWELFKHLPSTQDPGPQPLPALAQVVSRLQVLKSILLAATQNMRRSWAPHIAGRVPQLTIAKQRPRVPKMEIPVSRTRTAPPDSQGLIHLGSASSILSTTSVQDRPWRSWNKSGTRPSAGFVNEPGQGLNCCGSPGSILQADRQPMPRLCRVSWQLDCTKCLSREC